MKRIVKGLRSGGVLVALAWLVGCSSTLSPPSYYTLAPLQGPATAPSTLAIGVGPVTFPEWLDRSQVVTRRDAHRLDVHDAHRWAGTLKGEFQRVLAANLARLTGSDRVAVQPWGRYFQPDYRVVIDVLGFEGREDGAAVLTATWMLVKEPEARLVTVQQADITRQAAGAGTAGLVAAQNEALAELSRAIAGEILRQAGPRP